MNPILHSIIAYVPVCTTTFVQLSGIGPIIRIVKSKQTGSISAIPFVAMIICSILWLYYGFLLGNLIIFISSCIGLICGSLYFGLFVAYTTLQLRMYYLKMLVASSIAVSVFIVTPLIFPIDGHKYDKDYIAFGTSLMAVLAMCSPLASMKNVLKEKDAESMSLIMSVAIITSSVAWIVYGFLIMHGNLFIVGPSVFGAVAGIIQLSLIYAYPSKCENEYGLFVDCD